MATIVLDPGHGGNAAAGGSSPNNAKGPAGTLEKGVTLDLATRAFDAFNGSGDTVILTRSTDVNLGLSKRAKIASDAAADVFVSIHFNGNNSPTVQGTEVWVHPVASDDSRLLATSILQRILSVTGYSNRGLRSNDWGVLNPAIQSPATAACLVEISFLTDPGDESRLQDEGYKNQLAAALVQAISDYVNRASSNLPPPLDPVPGDTPSGGSDA